MNSNQWAVIIIVGTIFFFKFILPNIIDVLSEVIPTKREEDSFFDERKEERTDQNRFERRLDERNEEVSDIEEPSKSVTPKSEVVQCEYKKPVQEEKLKDGEMIIR